jgi:hypothetical protein
MEAMAQYRTTQLERDQLDPRRKWDIYVAPGDCELTSSKCALYVGPPGGVQQPLFPTLDGNLAALLQSLSDYAQGLQDVVNSDSAGNVSASLADAVGGVTNLANAVVTSEDAKAWQQANAAKAAADKAAIGAASDSPQAKAAAAADQRVVDLEAEATDSGSRTEAVAKDVSTYATPVGNVTSWLIGEYIAAVQVAALRTATSKAEPWMQRAAPVLKAVAQDLAVPARKAALDHFRADHRAYELDTGDTGLRDKFVASALSYNNVLAATGSNVFDAMLTAHTKLCDQLNGRGAISLADVAASIQVYAKQAEALQNAVASLQAK